MGTGAPTKVTNTGYKNPVKILREAKHQHSKSLDLLLLVVCRICKYAGVKMTLNAITAPNHYSMLIYFQEFIIKDDFPLSVVDFSLTVGHEHAAWALSTKMLCHEGFKCIRELSFTKAQGLYAGTQLKRSYSLPPGRRHVQMLDRRVLTFCPLTHSLSQDKLAIV